MPLTIGVLNESTLEKTRVALVPEVVKKLHALGATVRIQTGAGLAARIPDTAYEGAAILDDPASILSDADVLLTVHPPAPATVATLKSGAVVVGFLQPLQQEQMIEALCANRITSFAMELVPRISRAQSMDALSSQASIAG